jgi:antibiotic biosynthesis monooxygenase
VQRRNFISASAITIATMAVPSWAWTEGERTMFGLIGKMITVPGKRDELMAILLSGVDNMPGCLSYVVAADENDANAIWVTEVWVAPAVARRVVGRPFSPMISSGRL